MSVDNAPKALGTVRKSVHVNMDWQKQAVLMDMEQHQAVQLAAAVRKPVKNTAKIDCHMNLF